MIPFAVIDCVVTERSISRVEMTEWNLKQFKTVAHCVTVFLWSYLFLGK